LTINISLFFPFKLYTAHRVVGAGQGGAGHRACNDDGWLCVQFFICLDCFW